MIFLSRPALRCFGLLLLRFFLCFLAILRRHGLLTLFGRWRSRFLFFLYLPPFLTLSALDLRLLLRLFLPGGLLSHLFL